LERNELTGDIPTEWRELQRLRSIKLRQNKLCGGEVKSLKKWQEWLVEKLHPLCDSRLIEDEPPPSI
jgi:hypothetical protein